MQIKPSLPSFIAKEIPTSHTQRADLSGQSERHAGNLLFERQKKQMQDMQNAVVKLQELKKNSSPKKIASQRAALLKQRLDTLKSIMTKLPPGDYKVLVQELKQIAKELAALSKQMGSSSSTLGHMPAMSAALGEAMAHSASEESAGIEAAVESASSLANIDVTTELSAIAEAQATAEQAIQTAEIQAQHAANPSVEVEHDKAKDNEQHNIKMNKPRIVGLPQNEDTDDKALRTILTEASKTLKEVVSLLKAKQQVDDKDSRKLFTDIAREQKTLDLSLQQSMLASSGSESVPSAGIETPSSIGMGDFVDISV